MTTPGPDQPPRGLWLVATHKLARPVPVSESYPHVHASFCACHPWQEFGRRDCAACQDNRNPSTQGGSRNG